MTRPGDPAGAVDATLPRAGTVVRFGITGHRLNKLGVDGGSAVEATIRRTLDSFVKSAERMSRHLAAPDAPVRLHFLSALAEGADRMAFTAAVPHWERGVVLPMPVTDYEDDFLTAGESESQSLSEFRHLLGQADTVTALPLIDPRGGDDLDRSRQYEALGAFLVQQIDILLAVWDGRPADGPGGTAAVIARALTEAVPVVWIRSDGRGEVVLLSGTDDDIRHAPSSSLDAAGIDALMAGILGIEGEPPVG